MSAHDGPQYGIGDASFQAAGGADGIYDLVSEFYRHMDSQYFAKRIRGMHPEDLASSIDKLYRFLCGWLGGPQLYQERYGEINIPAAHFPFQINSDDSVAWLSCMSLAIKKQNYEPEFAQYLLEQLQIPAERILMHG